MKPLARRDGLAVRELPDELLAYDLERHEAHCLNPTAALVFKHCDGRRSVKQVARILRRVGLAAAMLPAVATVLAPTPAEAAVSTCIPAFRCTGAGTPPNPCYTTSPSLCGTCTCIGPGTCSPGC